MAGERRGRLLEAVIKAALEEVVAKQNLLLAWDEPRAGLAIRPDLLISTRDNTPKVLFLITWEGSRTDVKQKLWRDVGEIVDSTCSFRELVFCSVRATREFSGKEKAALIPLVSQSSVVAELEGGPAILRAIEDAERALPTKLTKIAAATVADAICTQHRRGIIAIQKDLGRIFATKLVAVSELRAAAARSSQIKTPAARKTYVKLATAQLLLLSPKDRIRLLSQRQRLKKADAPYLAVTCGTFASRVSPEPSEAIQNACALLGTDSLLSLCDRHEEEVKPYVIKLENVAKTRDAINRFIKNPASLGNSSLLLSLLTDAEPSERGSLSVALRTMVSLRHGKQGSGLLDRMADYCNVLRPQLHGIILPSLERGETLSRSTRRGIARAFADTLAGVSASDMLEWSTKVDEQVRYIFRTSLMSHGVDPLRILVQDALTPKWPAANESRVASWLGPRAAAETGIAFSGNDLSTRAICVGDTVIHWKSAYGGHEVDKTKELAGRVFAMREWVAIKGLKRYLLALDGEFSDVHVRTLIRCGWDDVFYADEMDRLVKAIV